MKPAPNPNMYAKIPAPEYHEWDAASKSQLAIMAEKSPLHLNWIREHGDEPTEAKDFGSAAHSALFEPKLFEDTYTLAGTCETVISSKQSKRCGQVCGGGGLSKVEGKWACGTHGGEDSQFTVKPDDYENIIGIREAVKADPIAAQLIRAPGWTEVSFVWKDLNTEELCKTRIDRLGKLEGFSVNGSKPWTGYAVTDLKSSMNAGPRGFRDFMKTFSNYHYQLQTAMNLVAVMNHFNVHAEQVRFFYVAVEPKKPHALCVYEPTREVLDWGWQHFQQLLRLYAKCKKENNWPGYSGSIREIGLPGHVQLDKYETEYPDGY